MSGHNINAPMFASANNKTSGGAPGDPPAWLMEGSDPLDVDLLAEYLLDDGKPAPNGMTFDFSMDTGSNGNVISPEQSEDGAFPPMAEGNNHGQQPQPQQQQHQQHAAQPGTQVAHQPQPHHQAPAPHPTQPHHQPHQPQMQTHHQPHQQTYHHPPQTHTHHQAVSAPPQQQHIAVAPAGVPVAPAPVYAPAPGQMYAPQPVQTLAPAPPLQSNMNGAQHLVVHHHDNDDAAKRQRIEAPAAAVAHPGLSPVPSAAPTSSIVSGGQQLVDAAQAAAMQGGRGRKKSQAQIDRRRERNRILARRTRLRKKFFFESLQKEVMDLQRQNAALKDLVKSKFSMEESRKVLDTCKAAEKLPEAVVEACGEHAAEMDQQDFNLVRSVQQSQHSFIITDPCLQDNPIVFASDGFLKVTGYAREDVLGRNCRFLQGQLTDKSKVDQIRRGVSAAEDVTVTLANYMADGTPFWNKLFIAALRDSSNNIVNFIGVVVKVASPPEGDPEFGKVLAEDGQSSYNGNTQPAGTAVGTDGTVQGIEGGMNAAAPQIHMP